MALIGFPDNIRVVLGNVWFGGGNGLSSGQTLILKKVPAQNAWSESGSATPNTTNNRLRISFFSGPNSALINMHCAQNNTNWFGTPQLRINVNGLGSNYNFLDLWRVAEGTNTVGASLYQLTLYYPAPNNGSFSIGTAYNYSGATGSQMLGAYRGFNTSVFSQMEEEVFSSSSESSSSTDPVPVDKTTYQFV